MLDRFLCIILLIPLQVVLAHEQNENELDQPYNIDTKPFLAAELEDDRKHTYGCGGNFRSGYIQSSIGSDETLSASALGGELGCGYGVFINGYLELFNSMEDQTIDTISGGQGSAMIVNLQYPLFEFITFGTAFGKFHSGDKHKDDIEELDLYIAVNQPESIPAKQFLSIYLFDFC